VLLVRSADGCSHSPPMRLVSDPVCCKLAEEPEKLKICQPQEMRHSRLHRICSSG
jgi:hypothetical protein